MNPKEIPLHVGAKARTIHVDYLTRVEGEGSLFIHMEKDKVQKVELRIFEPPRFFEALLQGRSFFEAPDITARICGICPVAYQMSAVQAMENALGVTLPRYLQDLRRLLYCGEWIESHTLHIYLLHAPDFFGVPDVVALAKKDRQLVERGLKIKKAGNEILRLLGGRAIHPINVKVGGFYHLPKKQELLALKQELLTARDEAEKTVLWSSTLAFPSFERDYTFVSLCHDDHYPIEEGKIASSLGKTTTAKGYEEWIEEIQVPYSTALQAQMKQGGAYLVGPIARYNLNQTKLSPPLQEMIRAIHFEPFCKNPFRSIIIRSLEVLYALHEAIRIIDSYDAEKNEPSLTLVPRGSIGYGATEAPRGLLYHRYQLSSEGSIEKATLIPPTSQNQKVIEEDLYNYVNTHLTLPDEELRAGCERMIRNYDPCISCSTHFLKLERIYGQ